MIFRPTLAAVVIAQSLLLLGCNGSSFPKAVYENMEYVFREQDAWLLAWPGGTISKAHVRMEDGKIFPLQTLPERVASRITGDDTGSRMAGDATALSYSDGDSSIEYRNGRLAVVRLSSYSSAHKEGEPPLFTIAADRDGPFEEMPRTKEELVALFGQPVKWDKYYPPATP